MNGMLGALTGAAMASLYVGSLWFAVRLIVGWYASLAVFWLGLAALARAALVGVWFFVLARLGCEVAVGAFAGFLVVRAVMVGWMGG